MIVRMKSMAQELAHAARKAHELRTGHAPSAATLVLGERVLVITLYGALTVEEQALAADPAGAMTVQKFHRQLFSSTSDDLCQQIMRITGCKVRETSGHDQTTSGAVLHAFPNGTMVQVFPLSGHRNAEMDSSIPRMSQEAYA